MKKSFRIICLVLAIAFAASMLISIVCSIALADGMDTRGETVYVETDAEGNVLSMISSVYITNMSGADTVTDDTTLTNIKKQHLRPKARTCAIRARRAENCRLRSRSAIILTA